MFSEQEQLPSIGNLLQKTFEKWNNDEIPRHSAVLAFYALFAFAPILLLSIEVMGLLYGRDVAEAQVLMQLTSLINSSDTVDLVKTTLNNVLPSSASWWVTIGFVIALLFGASSFFGELTIVLNQIWGIQLLPDNTIRELVLHRLQAVIMVLLGSLLILCGLLITALLTRATEWVTASLNLDADIVSTWSYLTWLFMLLMLVFALIYKFVPNRAIAWQDVFIGAAATALLISVTRLLISWYFSYSRITTMFGAASALVVLLLWIYYSAQIFFLGAEFTYVYSHTYGTRRNENADLPERDQALQVISDSASPASQSYVPAKERDSDAVRHPPGPIELEVVNIEPAASRDSQPVPENPWIKKTLAKVSSSLSQGLSRWISWSARRNEASNGEDRSPTDEPQAESSASSKVQENPPFAAHKGAEAVSASGARKVHDRAKQLVTFPGRIIRPLREIIVAVAVIGTISLAALLGIPWWRKGSTKTEDSPEQVGENKNQ